MPSSSQMVGLYLGVASVCRDTDTLYAEVAVHIASFVGSHFYIRSGSVHCYTANSVRAGIRSIERYLYGCSLSVQHYKVSVGRYESCLAAFEDYLIGFQYKLFVFDSLYGLLIGHLVGSLFLSFQSGSFCVSLCFTVSAAYVSL